MIKSWLQLNLESRKGSKFWFSCFTNEKISNFYIKLLHFKLKSPNHKINISLYVNPLWNQENDQILVQLLYY
ncbi:hypothetical protein Leryth_007993 [Lithospermum erythrorhizon]|nr:hypothetical protein Leryth_007993 [Lithospermum erythrorhizon]